MMVSNVMYCDGKCGVATIADSVLGISVVSSCDQQCMLQLRRHMGRVCGSTGYCEYGWC